MRWCSMTIGKEKAALRGASVRLINVMKRFGAFTAVDHVSLDVRAGEFLTLLGPSGSGKTTILSMIAGIEDLTEGAIEVGGRRVDMLSPDKRNVGMVFQNYALFPHMTVAQNVAFPLRVRGLSGREIDSRVQAVLELVRLPDQASKYPWQLSGGQQQRIAVARALIYDPIVLLMDEPLGALDRRLREIVQLELIELHRSISATIVYVTHDQDEALRMSDRIVILRDGKMVQVGTPRQIYDEPADAFVADFVGESTSLSGRVRHVNASACCVEIGDGLTVRARVVGQVDCGAEIRLVVRPEKVNLSGTSQDGWLPALVADVLYLGDSTRYRVQLDGGPLLVVRSYNRADQSSYSVGDRVFVRWEPEDAAVLS